MSVLVSLSNYLNAALVVRVSTLEKEFAKMSREQDDLAAAVATLTTAVSATAAEISTLVADVLNAVHAPTGVDPAAAEAAAVSIGALATQLNNSVSAAHAAMAAPAPTPAP